MFKLELVIKYKSLSSARLGLAWFISQAKLELYIKPKLKLNINVLTWDPTQVYYQAYIKFII